MNDTPAPLKILHLHSTFNPGGKELRCVRLMNAFGPVPFHAIVSAETQAMGAAGHISRKVKVGYPGLFPPLAGLPTPWRLQKLAEAMREFDLVLTYNWGAMDAVMAHTMFTRAFSLPPLVHHEDGFNEDEADGLKSSRNWYRRLALGRADALIVPSRTLERIARDCWLQPAEKVHRIANGIDTKAFAKTPRKDILPRLIKREGESWVGTLAGLRRVKNLPRLVRSFASLPEHWQLVIVGEGPELEQIRREAQKQGVVHRVHLPGFAEASKVVGLFDIFALSSDSEQFPLSVVEAMAAGLPVAAPAVGDVGNMVAEANRPFVVPWGDEVALTEAIARLAADGELRRAVGKANRERACQHYDEARMVTAYRRLYAEVLGRASFP